MASSNVCWGVEIGAGAVKAVKLEADGERVRVLDFASVPHSKVLSTPELDTDDATRVALGALLSQVDLSGAAVAISVPGHQSFARFAKLPPVEPKKVPDIVKFEAVQQIPFPLEDVEWDYQTFVSPNSPDVEVGIFAITRPRIMEKLQLLGDMGVTPDLATISPVAAYNALAYDLEFTEDTPGTIILDIGTTASDIIIADAGRVWVRTFPIGGHQFTDALVSGFKLTYSKAERLKKEAEQTKHARHVFQAMRPVFTDLVQEIQRSIGFYQSVHAGADLKRLIGLGSTFHLPGLRKYLKQQLQMDVYRMEQFKKAELDGPREAEFHQGAMNMATAYGLALQGLGMGALNANLMPVKVVREAMWRRKRVWFGVAAGLAATATAAMFLRPLLDQSAFTAAERPDSISRLEREAGRLKTVAQERGVTENADGDATAARIVGLLSNRDLMARLSEDVYSLVAFGESAARDDIPDGQRALAVASMGTQFIPKGGGDGFGGQDPYGGRDPYQRPGAGGGAAAPDQPADPNAVDPAQFDRVEVQMVLETFHPDPRDFTLDAIEKWFLDHAEREGVPYRVLLSGQPTVEMVLAGANDPAGGTGTRFGSPQTRTVRPGGGPGGFQGSTPMTNAPRWSGGAPGGFQQPGRPAGGQADDPTDEELARNLEQWAPVERPADAERPQPTAIISVTWQMLLSAGQEEQS